MLYHGQHPILAFHQSFANLIRMTIVLILLCLMVSHEALANSGDILQLPENPRLLALGGAFVAVADDPQAGIYNPAGIRQMKQVGMDLDFTRSTNRQPDHLGCSLVNPGADHGSAFALGIWTQGLIEKRQLVYYVPYTGTGLDLTRLTHLGLVMRFPYRASTATGISSRWATVADASLLQTLGNLRLGAAVERIVGGASDLVPRTLRVGLAYKTDSGVTATGQWQGEETRRRYDFHREASSLGVEFPLVRYLLVRAGYKSAETHRYSVGAAVGNIKEGFRLEAAGELPTTGKGVTVWSVGAGYRI